MKVYKLRDRATGQYARAGLWTWTKTGKTWSAAGHLRLALRNYRNPTGYKNGPLPDTWDVVELERSEIDTRVVPAREFQPR